MRNLVALTCVLLTFAVAGCTRGPEPEVTPTATPAPTTPPKPEIQVPDGEPPAELQVIDEEVGSGRVASQGDFALVHYVGVSWSTREEFDSSYEEGKPFVFQVGAGGVIDGWDEGVSGMRVGGRRRLIVPPEKGYGTSGYADVAPTETLIFVIDLMDVVPPQE